MILHGIYIMGIMDYILVGGSYSSVYVPPPMYFLVLVMYIHVVFVSFPSIYILYVYFFVHITPSFTFYQLCEIYVI